MVSSNEKGCSAEGATDTVSCHQRRRVSLIQETTMAGWFPKDQ